MTFLRKLAALLLTAFAHTTTYRAEMVLWALSGSMPIILMGVWSQAARSGSLGYSPIEMVRYFVAVLVIRQMTFVWVIWEFEESVVRGRLSHDLLRPIDPVWRYLANHLAERIARFPAVLALVLLCFWLYPDSAYFPGWWVLAQATGLILATFVTRFALQYTLATLCFYNERASSLESLAFIAYTFLSGMLAPLDLYPPVIQQVASWTPFPYLIFAPARLLIGEEVDVLGAFQVMGAWTVGIVVLQRWAWRKGLSRYSAMGA
ncbi:MAG TPA: ABC-2 family transporter protein [Polyangiaceae bacterium]|nr:ABC-2 family transporter protein [Polyangiaceae bacterium]